MATLLMHAGAEVGLLGNNKDGSLDLAQCQAAVGGFIERVHLHPTTSIALPSHELIVDEEGLLKDKPLNLAASFLAGQAIRGDAILVKYDSDGRWF